MVRMKETNTSIVLMSIILWGQITSIACRAADSTQFYREIKNAAQRQDLKEVDSLLRLALTTKDPEQHASNLRSFRIAVGYIKRDDPASVKSTRAILDGALNQTWTIAKENKNVAAELIELLDQAASLSLQMRLPKDAIRFYEQEYTLRSLYFPSTDSLVYHERLAKLYRELGDLENAKIQDNFVSKMLNRKKDTTPTIHVDEPIWGDIYNKQGN
jgi:hypothetical protein